MKNNKTEKTNEQMSGHQPFFRDEVPKENTNMDTFSATTETMNLPSGEFVAETMSGSPGTLSAVDTQTLEVQHVDDIDLSEIPFPENCLPKKWRELAIQSADLAHMPVQLPAMTMLATISAAIGKCMIATNASNYGNCRGNLYVIACAKSSTGKDVAARLANPLFEYEKECEKKRQDQDFDSLFDCEDVMHVPVLSISNATLEALADRMKNSDETLFSFSPEAGDLMRVACGIYRNGKGEFAFYNGAWSGSYTQFSRISREDVRIDSPCLTICWFVQPNYFAEMTKNPEAMHSGFISRCLTFDAETKYEFDDGVYRTVSPDLDSEWTSKVKDLLKKRIACKSEKPEEIPCTNEAREILRQFHNKYQRLRRQQDDIATMLGKARENAIRVALVLAVMSGSQVIGAAEASGGCAIVDWCLSSTLKMMRESRSKALEQEADKLAAKLKSKEYGGQATIRDLKRRNGYEEHKIRQFVGLFPERFEVVKTGGNGRPSEKVQLKS